MRFLLPFIFLTGCCSYNTGNQSGGFPARPELTKVTSANDIVENYGKLIFYMESTEKAKEESPYVE